MKNLVLLFLIALGAVFSLATGAPEGIVSAMAIPAVDSRGLYTKKMIAAVMERIKPTMFLKSFFPSVVESTKYLSIEVQRGTEKVAADVLRGTTGNRNTFSRSTERIYMPPLYHEYFTVSELEVYDRAMAQESPAAFADMVRKTADYMSVQRDKIERALELQCSQILQTGIVLLKNGDNIDYKRKAASMVDVDVAGDYWNVAGGDPIADITAACEFLRTVGKYSGGTINMIAGSKALNALINNDKFQKISDLKTVSLTEINPGQRNSEGATVYGKITAGSWDVRIWTYPGFYETNAGVMTPFIDPENAVFLPETTNFKTGYALVPQVFNDQNRRPQTGEYLIQDFLDEKAATHEAHIKSAPLAIPVLVDQIVTLKVTA